MNVDDVYLVLHYHWAQDVTIYPDGRQRLQVSFLMLISTYTATRPGALVYVARNVKEYKGAPIGDEEDDGDADESALIGDKDDDGDEDESSKVDEIDNDGNMEVVNKDEDEDIEMDNKNENGERDDETVKAFLGHLDRKEPVKTICYEDVNLLLLPNPTGTRDLLALEIDLRYTKGH